MPPKRLLEEAPGIRRIALYIHFPWCVQKCPYCDFNSHKLANDSSIYKRYVQALIDDLSSQLPIIGHHILSSIFIGGGTPSLCPSADMATLMTFIKNHMNQANNIEITLEANPGSADIENFIGYRDSGINRLSIGAQSFNEKTLIELGRTHQPDHNFRAIEMAKCSDVQRINIDLIYAAPKQTIGMAENDIAQALTCDVDHISTYQLTLEPGTHFYRRPPASIPDDDTSWTMAQHAETVLSNHQYEQYEISAWGKQPTESSICQHNLNYWRFGDYLGIGAGAHGKISHQREQDLHIFRTKRANSPKSYMQEAHIPPKLTPIPPNQRLLEYMINQLRLNESFLLSDCLNQTGLELSDILDKITQAVKADFLEIDGATPSGRVRKTSRGKRFLNDLQLLFT